MRRISSFLPPSSLFSSLPARFFGVKLVDVPKMGDSISEGIVQQWNKRENEHVDLDEVVAVIETDKVKVDIRAPEAGMIVRVFAQEGDVVEVGKDFFELDTDKVGKSEPKAAAPDQPETKSQAPQTPAPSQEAPKQEAPTKAPEPKKAAPPSQPSQPAKQQQSPQILTSSHERKETRVPMSRLRQRVAQRLKESQNTYAFLTTFNEIDMSELMNSRKQFGEEFQKANGVKLGFMSYFIKAVTTALKERPIVNAVIEGNEVIHRNYVDVSVAVQGPDGLVVPVIRDADKMSFSDIEKSILDLGNKAKNGTLAIEDMVGGTITVSNGKKTKK